MSIVSACVYVPMISSVILMQCVKAGGDRQILHEAIREHSMAGNVEYPHPVINRHHSTIFFLLFIHFFPLYIYF